MFSNLETLPLVLWIAEKEKFSNLLFVMDIGRIFVENKEVETIRCALH